MVGDQHTHALALGRFMEGRVPAMLHPGLPSHPRHNVAMAQMDACDVEPLELITSDTRRSEYGNSSSEGIIESSARSASAPWPISRRPGLRTGRVSPTL